VMNRRGPLARGGDKPKLGQGVLTERKTYGYYFWGGGAVNVGGPESVGCFGISSKKAQSRTQVTTLPGEVHKKRWLNYENSKCKC